MSSTETAARRRPVIRLALILVGVVVLAIIVLVIGYFAFQSSRNMPLSVPVYSDAQQIGSVVIDTGHDRLRYTSSSPADEIGQFYQREIGECQRIENSNPTEDTPPFHWRCAADASSLFVSQFTIVTIQPGVGEYAGLTLIDIERRWGQ